MKGKLKNIIIFVGIGLVLVVLYLVLFGKKTDDSNLIVSNASQQTSATAPLPPGNSGIAQEFLAELLSIKSLELDDTVLSGLAFASLHDPNVSITQDEKEGRPNPFAPIGAGVIAPPLDSSTTTTGPTTTPAVGAPILPTTGGATPPAVPASGATGGNTSGAKTTPGVTAPKN